MNSLIETNEQTIDIQMIKPKLMQMRKSYSFFIYYSKFHLQNSKENCNLQKMTLKLKQQKNSAKEDNKQIYLFFSELDNENEVEQSIFDLKMQIMESFKTKIIVYGSEASLLELIRKANFLGVDISNIPIAIYSPGLHNDLAFCLGWREDRFMKNFPSITPSIFEQNVQKWIKSPTEKIDVWSAEIQVANNGRILKLEERTTTFEPLPGETLKQQFISHFSVGYHSNLAHSYEQKRKSHNYPTVNKCIYSMEGFKKFCCVGSQSIQTATGIVNIRYKDQKGVQYQILKQFHEDESQFQQKMQKQKKSPSQILTVLISNIDRFHGQKLPYSKSYKMNDSKIELLTFQSLNKSHHISTIGNEIHLDLRCNQEQKLNSIYIQINNTCYQLISPLSVKIKLDNKLKVLLNKDYLLD